MILSTDTIGKAVDQALVISHSDPDGRGCTIYVDDVAVMRVFRLDNRFYLQEVSTFLVDQVPELASRSKSSIYSR